MGGMSHQPPGENEIGKRLTIRLFLDEGGFGDLLGYLVSPTVIQKKDGSLVEFDPAHIFLWRVVEPLSSD